MKTRPINDGHPWTPELKDELAKLFHQGYTFKQLSYHFGRGIDALATQMERQKLVYRHYEISTGTTVLIERVAWAEIRKGKIIS